MSKRQLQSAADAASLAGAQELGKYAGTCTEVAANATARSAARASADQYAQANRGGDRQRTDWGVACSSDRRSIEVTYANSGSTPRLFGGLFGDQPYVTSRTATAAVGVPSAGYGLRPYFVCLADAQALRATSGTGYLQIAFPNPSCGNQPGNWYTADCPEDGSGNGTPVLAVNTRVGCESTISIVDTTAAAGNPSQIEALLLAACAGTPPLSASRGCLTGNTGNLPSNPIATEWAALLGEEIALPVFQPGTVLGTGNNAKYPVVAIVGVTVCAYKWNSKSGRSTAFGCGGVSIPTGNDNFLVQVRPPGLREFGALPVRCRGPHVRLRIAVCPAGQVAADDGSQPTVRRRTSASQGPMAAPLGGPLAETGVRTRTSAPTHSAAAGTSSSRGGGEVADHEQLDGAVRSG